MLSALTLAAAFALVAVAGAWLYGLAQSRWGDDHPRLRELALLGAFTVGVVLMAATVTLPARVAWAVIAAPGAGEVPELIG
jgi:hypothetical protein